jgi:ATP-dependent exoDNAse (exonuclease V) alpha subunit
MAIFHLAVKVISRGKGQSAIAAAAYRSGERLRDEQADEQKFYPSRDERIAFTAIMAPKDAPAWAHDRNELWNHAERAEKRKDAQLAREIEVSLPHELTDQQREWLVKDFAREAFVRKGYAVDIAIHAPYETADERNTHAHLMVTMRTLGKDGFATKKDRDLNKPEQLQQWREQWAHLANRHLERHGHEARIDHRSLKEQGIDREPTIHLGYAANEMGQRGAQSDRVDALQAVLERNEIRVEMKAIDAELLALERGTRHWEYSKTDPRYVNPILSSVVQMPPHTISSSEAKTEKQLKREEMERQWRSRDRDGGRGR